MFLCWVLSQLMQFLTLYWILFFNSGAGPQYSLMWTVQGLTLWCKILICIFLKINFYARLWLCKGYCILVSQTQQADAEIKKTPKHGLLSIDTVAQLTLDQRKLKRTDHFKKQHSVSGGQLSLDIHSGFWIKVYQCAIMVIVAREKI